MARRRIQGITIEIGGDTTKLQSALKGVESKLKSTQASLKDVNRLLKLDPGNTELLTQKQRLLGDSIQATKEKLQTLKDAQEQANQAMADGKMSQEQYDELQREIIETEQSLKSLTNEMKEFGSVAAQQVAAAGEKVKELGSKIESVGTGLTKYVTGPIVAVGAASVAAFNEVDEGLDIIVKKTGASGAALQDMEDRAKNLATSIPTDFKTAGEAIGEVNTRFGLTGQELEDLSAKFIKFASLNDTSVSSSIDNVQAAMAAMNVGTAAAGDFLDILNKAGQDTGVSMDKLTSDLTANATALREMGFGYNTAVGFLANLNKNGVDASSVMSGLKTALKNATKDGKTMGQAMHELMGKIKGAKSETKAMQIASELFGSKAGPAMAKAIREGRLSFDDFTNAVQDAGNSIDSTFENTMDPIDQFKLALNELKIVGMELVEAAAPMIKAVAETVKTAVSNIRSWWDGLSPLAQQTIIKAAGIVAAVGPVLVVAGKVVKVVGNIMTLAPKITGMISTVKTALTALWGVLAANPIVAVIAAITALVAGFVVLYNKCEWFRNAVNGLWNGIKTTVTTVGNAIGSVLKDKWANIKKAYDEHGGGLKGIAAATMQAIKEKMTLGFDIINKLTGGKLDVLKQKVTNVFNSVKDFIHNAIERIKSFFNFNWELPKIKLPHFKIEGKFSLNPPQVPHLTVEWYRKAMENGMILNSPTIFGFNNGRPIGGGDAGPEAVVGVDSLRSMIQSAVNQTAGRTAARNMTVVLQLDKTELGRTVYALNNSETQRVGLRLATT